jgi:hypothetical protein
MSKHRPLEECIVAAFDTGATLRGPHEPNEDPDPVERTVAIVQSEVARLRGNDLSTLNEVLAGQALALDTIFSQLARDSVEDNVLCYKTMQLALKAQAQSRTTLNSLVSFARPGPAPRRSDRNLDEQTGGNGNYPSR